MRVRCLAVFLGFAATQTLSGGTVAGRVVDSRGTAVVGARVVWHGFRSPEIALLERAKGTARLPLGETVTDGSGGFKVTFDKPAEGISLKISAAGLPSVELDGPYDPGEESSDIECILPESERLAGRVVDEAGKPLAGARIKAVDPDAAEGEALPFAETVSQADGTVVLQNAPKGASLRVELSGFASLRTFVSRSPSTLALVLKKGGSVEGKVVGLSGQAVEGAIVTGGQLAAETDAAGRYRLLAIPTGQVSLSVTGKGDLVARRDGVLIRRAEVAHVDLKLSRSAVIAGSVMDAKTRKPIGGARIDVSESSVPWEPMSGRSVRADAQGGFRFAGLLARAYRVSAGRRDYVTTALRGVVADLAKPATVAFALQRAAGIPGHVIDEKGSPVAGARVSVLPALAGRRSLLQGIARTQRATVTAADGGFHLRGVAPDPAVSIEASKEGFVAVRKHGLSATGGDTKPVTLVLRHGLEARGLVSDAQSQPIAGVDVRLRRRVRFENPMPSSGGDDASSLRSSLSDSQGRISFAGLEAGEYSARLSREGFASKTVPQLEVRADGANVWAAFVLEVSAPIAGFVRSRKGEPIAGAQVRSVGGEVSKSATSDSQGSFRLEGYARGQAVTVFASADGFARMQIAATAPAESVTIILPNTGEVRGRVEDADTKEPIEAFSIRAGTPRGSSIRFAFASDFRSPDGSFALASIPTGKVEVSATAPGYLETAATGLEIGEGESKDGVVLSLKRGRELNGRVLDPARGTAVPNATVSWRREHDSAGAGFTMTPSGIFMIVPNAVTTDADGHFRYEGLPPERLVFSASHPDYQRVSRMVDAGAESSLDLTLALGGSIAGAVVERDARTPVPGAEVFLEELGASGWGNDAARADASGHFRFDHLKEGRFRVNAHADSGRSAVRDVVLGQDQRMDDVLLQFAGGTQVRGRVTGLPAARLGGVAVIAWSADFQGRTSTLDDGTFVIDDAPPGPLRISANTGTPGRSMTNTVDVPEGAPEMSVEIMFEGGSRLTGVVMRQNRGVPGVWVSVAADPPSAASSRASTQTDAEGRYEMEGLSDANYRLQVSGPNVSVSRPVTVSGDTTFDVALGGGRISGIVTDAASSEPLADVRVRAEKGLEASGMSTPRGVTDFRGYYSIEDLEAATYQVTAQREGYKQKTQTVSVAEASPEANFLLSRGASVLITVVDGITGLPLKGLDVVAASSGGVAFQGSVQLDASGRGEISALSSGRYTLHFFSAGYAPNVLAVVDIPSPSLSIPMTPGGRVEVRTERPITGKIYTAGILCLRSPWFTDGTVGAAPPIAAWGSFAPGTYQLVVSGPDGNKFFPFSVIEGQTTTVSVTSR